MPTSISDPNVRAIFQPNEGEAPKALLVAGACGNVGFGKLGQFGRLLAKHGVPVIALDLSDAVQGVEDKLRKAFGGRFEAAQVDAILDNITVVQGTLADVPAELGLGFVFEAIPERLDIKRPFYEAIRARDPGCYVFSATSGLTTRHLFEGLPGADRSGVMHPFFPHLTNKLFEVPTRGCTTSKDTLKLIRKFLGGLGMNLLETADVPAFAADRIFCGMMLEAVRIHAETGLSPAQIDGACRKLLGTSPFYVHNLIPGANYLSAHCMQLLSEEVDSTLYAIPEIWEPYTKEPTKQWPYERGQLCPPEGAKVVEARMLGMLFSLSTYMLEHGVCRADQLNFLCENALAFRVGVPALMAERGLAASRAIITEFVANQKITKADEVAPVDALTDEMLREIYVGTSVHSGVGLISLKRLTINHQFIAELDAAYAAMAADPAVRAIVVAPDGQLSREFGHGADPNCFVPVLGKADAALELIQRWKGVTTKLRTSQKPTVAALVGRVLGGSNELASACHARVAGARTMIGQPEPTVGVLAALGGCHHIHRASDPAAYARINELLLTGHSFSAEEAAEWGYVSEIVPIPELPKASMAFAAGLADGSIDKPAFRDGPAAEALKVSRDVATTNAAGVPLDADLRELIASTVEAINMLPYAEAAALESERGAKSLTMSSAAIGVKAMLRGKPPQFEKPL
ncbi:enoyl-CoA hydratase/isomerase family protein [Pseudenhygromyxa sp. WMMC2535]|uniref:3-hydroxyacyl-CoA dehydrogenase/enoyl-CoA hydratase family protein n=1 Tax=Pseudenhygromyxa sp. WMMC2535 TaxID=2712867 RepID=UPI00155496F4|nr:enoyl-CoA hydratase-related protein [Pseudenhygromyxa sp. WMMC2535]NVB41889.1 enoyl-CoA hydratase/isomerase family protein [Pseudenhygromyxa sp. WMMC2535]